MNDDFKKIYYPFCIRYFYNNGFSVIKTQHQGGYHSRIYFTYEFAKNNEVLKPEQEFLSLEQALTEYPQNSYSFSFNFMNLSHNEKSENLLEALIAFYKENPKKEKNIYFHFNSLIGGNFSKDNMARYLLKFFNSQQMTHNEIIKSFSKFGLKDFHYQSFDIKQIHLFCEGLNFNSDEKHQLLYSFITKRITQIKNIIIQKEIGDYLYSNYKNNPDIISQYFDIIPSLKTKLSDNVDSFFEPVENQTSIFVNYKKAQQILAIKKGNAWSAEAYADFLKVFSKSYVKTFKYDSVHASYFNKAKGILVIQFKHSKNEFSISLFENRLKKFFTEYLISNADYDAKIIGAWLTKESLAEKLEQSSTEKKNVVRKI